MELLSKEREREKKEDAIVRNALFYTEQPD
jgi:hypothetical protein